MALEDKPFGQLEWNAIIKRFNELFDDEASDTDDQGEEVPQAGCGELFEEVDDCHIFSVEDVQTMKERIREIFCPDFEWQIEPGEEVFWDVRDIDDLVDVLTLEAEEEGLNTITDNTQIPVAGPFDPALQCIKNVSFPVPFFCDNVFNWPQAIRGLNVGAGTALRRWVLKFTDGDPSSALPDNFNCSNTFPNVGPRTVARGEVACDGSLLGVPGDVICDPDDGASFSDGSSGTIAFKSKGLGAFCFSPGCGSSWVFDPVSGQECPPNLILCRDQLIARGLQRFFFLEIFQKECLQGTGKVVTDIDEISDIVGEPFFPNPT